MRPLFVVLRIVFAIAAVLGIIWQAFEAVYVSSTDGIGPVPALTAFFSYFTVDSNAFFAVILVVGAILLSRTSPEDLQERHGYGWLRAVAVVGMVTTGIVYNVDLRTAPPSLDFASAANEALHSVGPLFAVVDWLVAPGRPRLRWRGFGWLLVFPLVWLVYTFARQPIATDPYSGNPGWLPYPFLYGTPAEIGLNVLVVVALIAALGALVVLASRLPRPGRVDRPVAIPAADVGGRP